MRRGTYVACELLQLDFSSVVHEVDHPPGTFTNAEVVERGPEQNLGVVRQVAVSLSLPPKMAGCAGSGNHCEFGERRTKR